MTIFGEIEAFNKTIATFNFKPLIRSSENLAKNVDAYGLPITKQTNIPLKVSILKTIGVKPTPQSQINSTILPLSVECACVEPYELPVELPIGSAGVGTFKNRKCILTINSIMIQTVGAITHEIVGEKFVGELLFMSTGGAASV